jgi:DNA-binding NarL/FixJ family response regulator
VFGKRAKALEARRSVNDIEPQIRVKLQQKTKIALREAVPIVVIDDQPFEAANNLRNNHYQINHLTDLNNIQDIKSYPIVLCDLQGVGSALHGDMQGAHLIREIKKNYPEKIVIAYTGIAKTTAMSKLAQLHADAFLKKDDDIDTWFEELDRSIERVSDPVLMWKSFRKRMLDTGMTPYQLMELEDAFVESIWDGSDSIKKKFEIKFPSIKLQADLRAVVQGFVSSLIFKALIG